MNPFAPPESPVKDVSAPRPAGPLRAWICVVLFAALSLLVSWVFVPLIAGAIAGMLFASASSRSHVLLFFDLLLTAATVFLGAAAAITFARRNAYLVALGVAAICWLVYFVEVGGIGGMLGSAYPGWYEFFPSHFGPAMLAAWLARRRA